MQHLRLALAAGTGLDAGVACSRGHAGCSRGRKRRLGRTVGRVLLLREEPRSQSGAESGKGVTATGANGSVPHWTNASGQFGAAAYTGFGVGWFNATSKGPTDRRKNYFFGGTTTARRRRAPRTSRESEARAGCRTCRGNRPRAGRLHGRPPPSLETPSGDPPRPGRTHESYARLSRSRRRASAALSGRPRRRACER